MKDEDNSNLNKLNDELVLRGYSKKTIKAYYRIIQKYLGHKDLKTTQIYTHVANKDITKLASLL